MIFFIKVTTNMNVKAVSICLHGQAWGSGTGLQGLILDHMIA